MTTHASPQPASLPRLGLDYLEDLGDKLMIQAQWSGAMPHLRTATVPGSVEDLVARRLPRRDGCLDRGEAARLERLRW